MTWLVVHTVTGERRRFRNEVALAEWSVVRDSAPSGWWRLVEITVEADGAQCREVAS